MDPSIVAILGVSFGGFLLMAIKRMLSDKHSIKEVEYYSARSVLEQADNAGPINYDDPKVVDAIHQRISAEITAYGAGKTVCHCFPCSESQTRKYMRREWQT
jgi:hypothetical protein